MKEQTVSLGTKIVAANEKLTSINMIDLYEMISHPEPSLRNQTEVLRSIQRMDSAKYNLMKKSLPYFVCAHFEPSFRRKENFSSLSSFVLDIDHVDEKTIQLHDLKAKLAKDDRIAMMFTSPSGCGLKLIFLLNKPCTDENIYSSFYKQFAWEFAKEHQLETFIDLKTNDVTRACFIAADDDATLNLTAMPVCWENYVNLESVDLFIKEDKMPSISQEKQVQDLEPVEKTHDPDQETMGRIKERLELNKRKKLPQEIRPVYVPQEITNIVTDLKQSIEETGVELYDTRNIQYGIKLMFRTHQLKAEINLFFGHKGYSVVESPKRGTSMQLNGMMAQLVNDYVQTLTYSS